MERLAGARAHGVAAARWARTLPLDAHAGAGHHRLRPDGSRNTHRQSDSAHCVNEPASGPPTISSASTAIAASAASKEMSAPGTPSPSRERLAHFATRVRSFAAASRCSTAAKASSRSDSRRAVMRRRSSSRTGPATDRPISSHQATTSSGRLRRSIGDRPKVRPVVARRLSHVEPPSIRNSAVCGHGSNVTS
jgi:hypothetical protein